MATADLMQWNPAPVWNTVDVPTRPAETVNQPFTGRMDSIPEQAILEQMPLVDSIARNIHRRLPSHVPLEDLVQAGLIGLINAAKRFDADRNVGFASFAQHRIRGAIVDSLRAWDWGSRPLRQKQKRIEAARETLNQQLGRQATQDELANHLDVSLEYLQRALIELHNIEVTSLDAPQSEDKGAEVDAIAGAGLHENPFHRYSEQQTRDRLSRCIQQLPERERDVVSLLYFEEMSAKEVAKRLGISSSRVSQLHARAIEKLRLGSDSIFGRGDSHARVQ